MTVVLLWDIDGTLLLTARAGVFALEAAAERVAGRPVDLQAMHTSGMTDAEIAQVVLRDLAARDAPDAVAEFLETYAAALPEHLPRRQGRVLPGVVEILKDLAAERGVLSLLLTGNVRAGADAKLTHYGLAGHFDDGAFCEGPGPRAEIARRALALAAERLGSAPDPARCFVIGDTPADVACADAIGVRAIGVASGEWTARQLLDAGAWRAYAELPAPAEFRRLVGLALSAP